MRHQRLQTAPETQANALQMTRTERSKSKRIAHGGGAWSLPDAQDRLKQPQDGISRSEDMDKRTRRSPGREPEDAGMTGGTRSLMRRVMGLNVTASPGGRKPARPAMVPNAHANVA